MLSWLTSAFAGTIIEAVLNALFGALRVRARDRERDAAIAGRAVAEAAGAALDQQLQTRKAMADAQALSPGSRDALADRLLREADEATAAAPG